MNPFALCYLLHFILILFCFLLFTHLQFTKFINQNRNYSNFIIKFFYSLSYSLLYLKSFHHVFAIIIFYFTKSAKFYSQFIYQILITKTHHFLSLQSTIPYSSLPLIHPLHCSSFLSFILFTGVITYFLSYNSSRIEFAKSLSFCKLFLLSAFQSIDILVFEEEVIVNHVYKLCYLI